jgi:hypothetical protein
MSTTPRRFLAAAVLSLSLGEAVSGRAAAQDPPKFPLMYQTTLDAPEAMFIADLNADGRNDLIALQDTNTGQVAVYVSVASTGLGTPAFYKTVPIPSNASNVNVADFTNDGKLDIVAYHDSSNTRLCVTPGNGAGGFLAPVPIVNNANSQFHWALIIGDVNEDGVHDIVASDGHDYISRALSNSVLSYTASTLFLPKYQSTASLVDATGDGKLDLVGIAFQPMSPTSNYFWSVLPGSGNGSFGVPIDLPIAPDTFNRSFLGDLTGDGHIDALLPPAGFLVPYEYQVLLGLGGGQFQFAAPVPADMSIVGAVKLGDVNNDSILDLVQCHGFEIKVGVKLGDGTGAFGPMSTFLATTSINVVDIADLVGDGNPDVVMLSTSFDTIGTMEGDGTGRFISGSLVSPGGKAATTGDFNGDGWPDLAMLNDNINLITGAGAGALNDPHTITTGLTQTLDIANADFNRDGDLDIAWIGFSGSLSVYLGDGAGGFSSGVAWPVIPSPSRIATADLNQDGSPDVVISGKDAACVLLSTGGGAFSSPNVIPYPITTATSSVDVGDFDENGWMDFVVGTTKQQKAFLVRATGGGGFAAPVAIYTGTTTDNIQVVTEVVDVNQDDHLDLLIEDPGDNVLRLAFGDGLGGFVGFATLASSGFGLLAAGDLNGDAVPDVITRSGAHMQVRMGKVSGAYSSPFTFHNGTGGALGYWISDMSADGFADIILANEGLALVAPNLRPNPAGTESFGIGTPGYRGFLGVMSNGAPTVGNVKFTLTCSNAPRFSLGALLIADADDPSGDDFLGLGFLLHLDLAASAAILGFDMPADAQGLAAAHVPFANDPSLIGLTVFAQAVFFDPVAGPSFLSLISSNALSVTLLP